jgi:histidinol-phosphate aminotransferase
MVFPVPIRPHLSLIKPYVPGKPLEELERELGIKNAAKIASNENPLGPSPKTLKALKQAFSQLGRYPDGGAYDLTKKLSAYLGVEADSLVLGNGSNEILVLLGEMLLQPGDEVIYASPSFIVYSLAAQLNQAKSRVVPLKNHTHDLAAFAQAITPKTRMVFICNPNNPTGTVVSLAQVEDFLKVCPPQVLVVLDEAYYEYVEEPTYFESLKLRDRYPNLVILRTFSKAFGLAGLRLGYGVVHPELAVVFQKTRQPFNVNRLAQTAALAALEDLPHMTKSVNLNLKTRKLLSDGLRECGFQPVPSQANFVYFETDQAEDLYGKLLHLGIIIRPMGPQALRVTTGTEEETLRFLKSIRSLMAGVKN